MGALITTAAIWSRKGERSARCGIIGGNSGGVEGGVEDGIDGGIIGDAVVATELVSAVGLAAAQEVRNFT